MSTGHGPFVVWASMMWGPRCGGLALPMAKYVGAEVRARLVPPAGDSVDGALHLASMAVAQSSSVPR
ncbi:hypothetical protein IHE31_04110 [Mycetohabitans rhizoxinica]|uniref:Uncharacterized protein n=2 Tax=Mycetohabitans rhizoxinica TaxID=412963 RepID=E5AL92_MYCRK|nr:MULTISPECIES: hypothetical protein [Mycetohabitans]MCG1046075.1 hypothetical protein [Mycetohabitans sp. B6]CBW73765.1 unnamed protein product [Mycetohabitans rhizoxinica HKI 454]